MANSKKKASKKKTTTKKKTTQTSSKSAKKVNNSGTKRRVNKNGSATSKKSTAVKKKTTTTKKKKVVQKPVEEKVVQREIEEQLKEQEIKPVEKETLKEEVKLVEEETTNELKSENNLKGSLKEIFDKRFLLFFVILILILIIFFAILIIKKNVNDDDNIEFQNINLKKYLNLYESNSGLEYIYITNKDCIGCDSYEVNLKKIENEFKIKIKKLDISDLDDDELKKIIEVNSYIVDINDVPILTSVKEKTTVSAINGVKEYSAIKNFITYSSNPSNKSFEKISIDKYLSLLKSKESIVIYIGTSSDSVCEKFSQTLEKVTSKKNIKVYYLNTEDLVTDASIKKLDESNEIFSKQWFVPTILIVKNSKIKDYRMYAMSEEELIRFLDGNKM